MLFNKLKMENSEKPIRSAYFMSTTKKSIDSSHFYVDLRRYFDWLNNLVTKDEKWCMLALKEKFKHNNFHKTQ